MEKYRKYFEVTTVIGSSERGRLLSKPRLVCLWFGLFQLLLFPFEQVVKPDKQLMEYLRIFFHRDLLAERVELGFFFLRHLQRVV